MPNGLDPSVAEAREFPDLLASWKRGRQGAKRRTALSGITHRLRKGGTA